MSENVKVLMRDVVSVKQARNGYVVSIGSSATVHSSLEGMLNELLDLFEWRRPTYAGDRYGEVVVMRGMHEGKPRGGPFEVEADPRDGGDECQP